ncbi:hypothetical protein OKA04_12205 [Luteolibacter flavescens]|uniref:Uncharacterized protein n=1 Tax=Luteolibacter flavescens TaxID=1859460 RepID=A0ABT3FPJ0_9BACT|nr:hypothetical protein [Luteolibacter flavescens]MCW1885493.1 hypothetical protein [Luteolibacter flavescens]
MKTLATKRPAVNAGKTQKRIQPTAAPASGKSEVLRIEVPRADLDVFTAFADHFALTPEMVMEHAVFAQVIAFGDTALGGLAWFDSRPPGEDLVMTELSFARDALDLLEFVASTLRRTIEELVANFLREEADSYAGEMEQALAGDGIDSHIDLPHQAQRVLASELAARRGRLPKDGNKKWDAWEWLNLQSYRPGAKPTESPAKEVKQ